MRIKAYILKGLQEQTSFYRGKMLEKHWTAQSPI